MIKRKNDAHEFKPLLVEIEEEPLNPLGRSIFWIVVCAIFFVGAWMCIGKVDVVVVAKGRVIPDGEIKVLQPLTTGVITHIHVKSGDFVKKGEVLMEIDPSNTAPELSSMRNDKKTLELEILRIECLLNKKPFEPDEKKYNREDLNVQKKIYRAAMERLAKQISIKEDELCQAREQLMAEKAGQDQLAELTRIREERLERLNPVQDIISRDEYETARSQFLEIQKDLVRSLHRIKELESLKKSVASEIDLINQTEKNKLLEELADKKKEHSYLASNIEKTGYYNASQSIRAPLDGYINKLFIHTLGGVVTPAEKLITLVPKDSTLVIMALVENKDVGFVETGMEATIKIDTFSFQKYGTLSGKVTQVSKDSIENEFLGLVYEVYTLPQETTFLIDGVYTSITTGMTASVEIKVGRRRIIEFFIYPMIKYLDEGISVR